MGRTENPLVKVVASRRTSIGVDRVAAAAELDRSADDHHVPEDAIAAGLAPDYLPTVDPRSNRMGDGYAQELGLK
jgi:hypothetical protein